MMNDSIVFLGVFGPKFLWGNVSEKIVVSNRATVDVNFGESTTYSDKGLGK
jgi:hypothetical protein